MQHNPAPQLVAVPAGDYCLGNEDRHAIPGDGEAPVRNVRLEPFWIDACAVTNARFDTFVRDTGHGTRAERQGWSFAFAGLLPDDFPPTRGVAAAPWWRQVTGADWRHPEGPQSDLEGREEHPVVHVSADDAAAFCRWAGLRLPTDAEWEAAARGGLVGARFPWGDDLHLHGRYWCNTWQGEFPTRNTGDDGFLGTCPVDAFPANGLGLRNTSGNTWEWTSTRFDAFDPEAALSIRGGSYLCHADYCDRYRVSARTRMTPESATGHLGFRCAWGGAASRSSDPPVAADASAPTPCCAPTRPPPAA